MATGKEGKFDLFFRTIFGAGCGALGDGAGLLQGCLRGIYVFKIQSTFGPVFQMPTELLHTPNTTTTATMTTTATNSAPAQGPHKSKEGCEAMSVFLTAPVIDAS
jgi:hypothetical protein